MTENLTLTRITPAPALFEAPHPADIIGAVVTDLTGQKVTICRDHLTRLWPYIGLDGCQCHLLTRSEVLPGTCCELCRHDLHNPSVIHAMEA